MHQDKVLHSIYAAVFSLDVEFYSAQKHWYEVSGHMIKHHSFFFLCITSMHEKMSLQFSVLKTGGRKITSKDSEHEHALFLAGNLF